jgi:YidC/Oxa1 family membrane protein insertase
VNTLAILVIFQPFEDLAEAIIKFFAETIGFGWGISIVFLTLTVRLATLPLSLTGIRSMRRMQMVAPELKAVQEKYKDDRERQQREMLALYKKHGVNPLASCFPFLLQIPFFIAVYGLLRSDTFAADVIASGAGKGFLFVDSIIVPPEGAEKIILMVLFLVTTVATFLYTTATTQTTSGPQRYIFLALPLLFVPVVGSQPAGLAVYWITTNIWSLGQQVVVQRIMPMPKPPTPEELEKKKVTAPPPPPPRKRKKRR